MVNFPICGSIPKRKGNATAVFLMCCDIVCDVGHSEEEIERKWDCIATIRMRRMNFCKKEKEDSAMQVTYNGFTGELDKIERTYRPSIGIVYDLSLYDSEKNATHSFTGVKLEDVKFLGGAVAFGG